MSLVVVVFLVVRMGVSSLSLVAVVLFVVRGGVFFVVRMGCLLCP